VRDERAVLDLDLPIDRGLLDVTDEVVLDAGVEGIALDAGSLTVHGWARLDRRVAAPGAITVEVFAGGDGETGIACDVTAAADGRFTASAATEAFAAAGDPGPWRLGVRLVVDGLEWADALSWGPGLRGWIATPPVVLADGETLAVRRSRDDGVTVALLSAGPVARAVTFAGDELVVSCVGPGGRVDDGSAVELRGIGKTAGHVVATEVVDGSMVALVPLELLGTRSGSSWQLWLQDPRGKARRLRPGPGIAQVRRFIGTREVVAQRTRLDGIRVAVRRPQPLLADASWEDGRLHLEIDPSPGTVRSVVLDADGSGEPVPVRPSGDRVVADLEVPGQGRWDVLVRVKNRERPLRVSHALLAHFPVVSADGSRVLESVDFDAAGVRAG